MEEWFQKLVVGYKNTKTLPLYVSQQFNIQRL